MKILKMIMLIGMIVSVDVLYAQNAEEMVFEKLTLDIPINDIGSFIESHKKIMDISMQSGTRTMVGQYVAAHRYSGKNTITLYNVYESVEDIYKDDLWSGIRAHADSLGNIDTMLVNEFSSMVGTWWSMFLEGHNDEIRTLRTNGFGNGDWEKPMVLVVSYYTPKWAEMNDFVELWEQLQPAYEQCGYAQMSRVSTHYSGSGPTVESLTGFKSWEDLAEWEANYQQCFEEHVENNTELSREYWDMAGEHWDEILIPVGQTKDQKFVLSEFFK